VAIHPFFPGDLLSTIILHKIKCLLCCSFYKENVKSDCPDGHGECRLVEPQMHWSSSAVFHEISKHCFVKWRRANWQPNRANDFFFPRPPPSGHKFFAIPHTASLSGFCCWNAFWRWRVKFMVPSGYSPQLCVANSQSFGHSCLSTGS